MNLLAHLLLADASPESRLGNVLPDLHRGRLDLTTLDPVVAAGVRRHRRTDAFTDAHPVFERSRARLREEFGHFSGVICDVLYDYCLSASWSRWCGDPREAFIAGALADLRRGACRNALTPRTRLVVDVLTRQDWLTPYGTVDGIHRTLSRLSARVFERCGRRVRLQDAAARLRTDGVAWQRDFDAFFPALRRYLDPDANGDG